MAKSKVLYGLLSFVMIGMSAGAILQFVLFRRMEENTGKFHWKNDADARILRTGLVKQEVISWSPRIFLYHNFLSPEECDYLIAIARPRLGKSTVVDVNTGKGVESKVRTSTSMFLTSAERNYPMIEAIEKRISAYAMIPVENGELLQVLRYEPGQFYRPHHDYFADEFNVKRGGQRVATFLMYLAEGMQGGETFFPWVGEGTCSCGGEEKRGTCIKPHKGDALLFWSQSGSDAYAPNSAQVPQ
ncbi:hypothetical protein KP509_01G130600 [Ceratopteris richardii]|uniref:Prolyl 4-hydroxylase alpha subunit domain-containing protein n=1 Tax=Ceratopteris richardii TaxID=49495 RepID=A0A8T2VUB4_CERRI|nr:hypothetical protein KP509_01G130600 [Ceratopteris richardii]